MKILTLFFIFLILTVNNLSQVVQNNSYQYFVDITGTTDDKLAIELITPKLSATKLNFMMPAYTAGSYRMYNYGRFVTGLKAFDENNNPLTVVRADTNIWEITGAGSLYKITYNVEDTYDATDRGEPVFEPAGTNFEDGKNFIFNNQAVFGYIEGFTKAQFELSITKPAGFYGATSMNVLERTGTVDRYTAADFFALVDNPLMYCIPDTTTIMMDNAAVLFSVYSAGKNVTSSKIAEEVKKVLDAHKKYIGTFPIDRYTFIMYLYDKPGISGSAGALEHNNSSVYFMPDAESGKLKEFMTAIKHVSAHEFFHIITPLSLHSREIADFNFNYPKMSKHLWLYEGVTEYAANLVQLRSGLINIDEFCKKMQEKMNNAERYDDKVSFTDISRGAYTVYKNQYLNVYEKGALIGFCLDVLIRETSGGSKGLMEILNELSKKYGKDIPFEDDELFGEIEKITSPAVGEFLHKHVEGIEPLPYSKISKLLGLEYTKEKYNQIDFGDVEFIMNQATYRFYFAKLNAPSKFTLKLGIKPGDEIVAVNRTLITPFNLHDIFGSPENSFGNGDSYDMIVSRFEGTRETLVKLEGDVTGSRVRYKHEFTQSNNFTNEQLAFRDKWLGK
jgi:predicted metalloprotease with PDZ domain